MLELLSTLLGSSALGTILGGVFAYLNRKADTEDKKVEREMAKDRMENEKALRQLDIEQVRAEAQGRREVAIVEGEASMESARLAAIAASQQADRFTSEELKEAGWWRWLLVIGSAMRTWIRPMATAALTTMALVLSFMLIEKLMGSSWAEISKGEKLDLGKFALNWVFAQASGALGYWFVARGVGKQQLPFNP